jgi:subtilisin family serine protease
MRPITWSIAKLLPVTGLLVAVSCVERQPVSPTSQIRARVSAPGMAAVQAGAPGRQVVALNGAESAAFDQAVTTLGATIERRHPEIGVVTVQGLTAAGVTALAARPDVASVDPDVTAQLIPAPEMAFQLYATQDVSANAGTNQSGAAFFPFQWNMHVIQAPAAWAASLGGKGSLVCDLDTGIDPDHIDLAGRVDLTKSTSFVAAEPTIQDFNTHGTFVSSIITSNGRGLASVAPNATLCAIKVLGTSGSGSFADVIAGILFATDEGADVINMSLGAIVDNNQPGVKGLIHAMQKAVDFAHSHGVVVVVAAGNEGLNLDAIPTNFVEIPGQLQDVVSVGATAPFNQANFDMLASYSNFGGKTGVSLVAPGGDELTGGSVFDLVLGACSHTQVTLPFSCGKNSFLLGAGTSFASPHVAGAAAEMPTHPGASAANVLPLCLSKSADNVGPASIFGAGRLNVLGAVSCK